MSEERESPAHITGDELAFFHREHNVNNKCLRCGHFNWNIQNAAAKVTFVGRSIENKELIYPELSAPVAALRCNNCATIWLIDQWPVIDWLASKKGDFSGLD